MYSSLENASSILYNHTPTRRKRSDSDTSSTSFVSFSTSPTLSKPPISEKRPPLMERKVQDDDSSWVQKAHELLSSLVAKTKEERTAASRTLIYYINNVKNSKDRKIIYFRKKLLDITYFNSLLNTAVVSAPTVSVQLQGSQNSSSLMTAAEISSPYLSDSDDDGVTDSVYIDHSNDVFETRDSPEQEQTAVLVDPQIDDTEREKTIGMIIKYFEEFEDIAKSEEFMDPYFCDQCRYIVTNEFLNYWVGERNLNLEQKLLVLPAFYKMFSENIALLMEDNIGMIDSCKSLMQELAIQLFYLILRNDIREYLSEVLGMIHDIIEKLVSMKIGFPHFYLHFFSYYLKNFAMANFNTKAYIDRVNKYLSLVYRFPESEEKDILVEFLQLCLLIRTNQVEEVKKKMKQSTTAAISYHVHPIYCLFYAEALYELCFYHGGMDSESLVLKCYNSYRSYLSCLKENQYLQQMVFLKEEDFSTPFPVFNLAKFLKIALKRIELNIGGSSKTAVVVNEVKYFSQVAGKYVEKKKNSSLTTEMENIEKKLRQYELEYNKMKTDEESKFKSDLSTSVQSVGLRWELFAAWCKKNTQIYDTTLLKFEKLKESRENVMVQFIQAFCEDQVKGVVAHQPQNQDVIHEKVANISTAIELSVELLKTIGFNTPIAENIYRKVNAQPHVMKLQPALFWIHQWIKNCLRTATEYENLFFEGLEMDQIITLYSKTKEFKALQIYLEELNMTHIFMLHKTTLGESKTSIKSNANYYYLVLSWYEAVATITDGFNLQNGIRFNDFSTQPVVMLVNNLATAKDICHYYNCYDNTKAAILIFTLPNSFDKYDQIKGNHTSLITKENHLWDQVVLNARKGSRHFLEDKHSIEGPLSANPLEVSNGHEQPRKSTAVQLCILQPFTPIVEYLQSHFVGCLFAETKS